MFTRPSLNSGIPIYVQLKEQIIHVIEKGALKTGDQLPSVRVLSEQLVINPNTVIKIYRELEYDGIIEIRHGSGAFVARNKAGRLQVEKIRKASLVVKKMFEQLEAMGLSDDEIRRLVESEIVANKS